LALFTGIPTIVHNCLKIGERIVVWRESDMVDIPEIVAAARAGSVDRIGVGGDLLRDWGAAEASSSPPPILVPAVIVEKCGERESTEVWEASSTPLTDPSEF
jgi:hypothetical protein